MFKLGCKPRSFHSYVPHMSAIIAGRKHLPTPPAAIDWTKGMPDDLGMMLNDQLGDCLVGDTLALAPGMIKAYRVPYEGPVVTIVTGTGKRLTSTRNHSVLTTRGFLAACLLQEGDYVVSSDFPEVISRGIDNNFNDAPTRIEDIFQSHERVSLPGSKKRQMSSSIDFHGDAQFFKSQIDVVDTNCFMKGSDVTAFGQPKGKQSFVPVSFTEAFDGMGAAFTHDNTIGLSSSDLLCRSRVSTFLLNSESVRSGLTGFGHRSNLYASPSNSGIKHTPTDPQLPGELIDRFAGQITLDRVIQIEHQMYSGLVYDLSTIPQWYNANGIIVHNCTKAAWYHAHQVWTFNACGVMQTMSDATVLKSYEMIDGYDPNDPSTDQGGNEQADLTYAVTTGMPEDDGSMNKLTAFVEIDPRNVLDVKRAITSCGLVYIGFLVPAYILPDGSVPPKIWALDLKADNTIIGGHAVILPGYDALGFNVVSWGRKDFKMTWAFFAQFVNEIYALIDIDFVGAKGTTPGGLTMPEWIKQMEALKNA